MISEGAALSDSQWNAIAALSSAFAALCAFVAVLVTAIIWWLDRKYRSRERRAALAEQVLVVPGLEACERFRTVALAGVEHAIATVSKAGAQLQLGNAEAVVRDSISAFNELYMGLRSQVVLRLDAAVSESRRTAVILAADALQDDVVAELDLLLSTKGSCAASSVFELRLSRLCGVLIECSHVD